MPTRPSQSPGPRAYSRTPNPAAVNKPASEPSVNRPVDPAKRLEERFGITEKGIETALLIKEGYARKEPVVTPDDKTRILLPETLLNHHLDLQALDDPLPLALMASRDPESPMAMAAIARFSPMGAKTDLVNGVFQVVGEQSRHPLVRRCVKLVTESAFEPDTILKVRHHTSRYIAQSRKQYAQALRNTLHSMLEGVISPRQFVKEFFELTEAGNMRADIRQRLVLSLILSPTVRPSVKFLMLENFNRLPKPARLGIISGVLQAEPTRHSDIIKEELRWIITQERAPDEQH